MIEYFTVEPRSLADVETFARDARKLGANSSTRVSPNGKDLVATVHTDRVDDAEPIEVKMDLVKCDECGEGKLKPPPPLVDDGTTSARAMLDEKKGDGS